MLAAMAFCFYGSLLRANFNIVVFLVLYCYCSWQINFLFFYCMIVKLRTTRRHKSFGYDLIANALNWPYPGLHPVAGCVYRIAQKSRPLAKQ